MVASWLLGDRFSWQLLIFILYEVFFIHNKLTQGNKKVGQKSRVYNDV